MYALNQLKRELRLLNQSNRQMFNNEFAELFSRSVKVAEQQKKDVETDKMIKFKNHFYVKAEKLILRSTLIMLLLTSTFRVWAQSDPSPAQSVSPGNEPYMVTATTGSTYTWSITPGTSGTEWKINGTGNNITVDWNITGVYTLSVVERNASGCIGQPKLVIVTVTELPRVIATPSSEAICSSSATNIALSSNIGNATFAWTAALTSGTATGFSNGTGATIVQTLTNTGTSAATVSYTITPTANGTAGTPLTVVVTVYPVPVPKITPTANPVCFGTEGVVYTTEPGMTSYTWLTTGGIVSAGGTSTDNTIAVTWNGSAPYSLSINYRDAHGCTANSPTIQNVTVNPLPVTSPIYHN
ncbi:MAG: PKD-like domain-containing protein [Bacteroidales bacterium]